MGFLMKSGVLFPGGISLTYCVMITPGTLDLFLMTTVNITKEVVKKDAFLKLFRKEITIQKEFVLAI